MSFDCVVQGSDGARDSVAVTDLIMDENLLVSWKYDEKWTGKVQNIQDTNDVEILWDNNARTDRVNIHLIKLLYPETYLGKRAVE